VIQNPHNSRHDILGGLNVNWGGGGGCVIGAHTYTIIVACLCFSIHSKHNINKS